MSGKKSRDKGTRGELELAHWFADRGYRDAHRGAQRSGSPDSPDVKIPGLERYHIECKRNEALALYPALEQAIRDGGDKIPVVIHRRNRKEWVAIMRLEDWLEVKA